MMNPWAKPALGGALPDEAVEARHLAGHDQRVVHEVGGPVDVGEAGGEVRRVEGRVVGDELAHPERLRGRRVDLRLAALEGDGDGTRGAGLGEHREHGGGERLGQHLAPPAGRDDARPLVHDLEAGVAGGPLHGRELACDGLVQRDRVELGLQGPLRVGGERQRPRDRPRRDLCGGRLDGQRHRGGHGRLGDLRHHPVDLVLVDRGPGDPGREPHGRRLGLREVARHDGPPRGGTTQAHAPLGVDRADLALLGEAHRPVRRRPVDLPGQPVDGRAQLLVVDRDDRRDLVAPDEGVEELERVPGAAQRRLGGRLDVERQPGPGGVHLGLLGTGADRQRGPRVVTQLALERRRGLGP